MMNIRVVKNTVVKLAILPFLIIVNFEYVAAQDKNALEVLFLGSSYFNTNDLPFIVKSLTEFSGKEIYVDQYAPSGITLSDHANSVFTETKIKERNWDYVILQGVGVLTAYPKYDPGHDVYSALQKLKTKIHANSLSTRIVFCLPWAFEDGMTWLEGWTDTYEDMQVKIYNNTIAYSNSIGFTIAPVGWAWYKVLKEKDYPLHYLHMSDWNHPSYKGSYLMACVIYYTIFCKDTAKVPFYGRIPEDEAVYFQKIAGSTVFNDVGLWNITVYTDTTSTGLTQYAKPNTVMLYQNYPNPFCSFTYIEYEICKKSTVEVNVFDLIGNKYATFLRKNQQPGKYLVTFDSRTLKSGIYFYSIKANDYYKVNRMLLLR